MSSLNIQADYLNYLKQKQIRVTIYLKNGINLEGIITEFDDYMIALDSKQGTQTIYKQVVTTINPSQSIKPQKFINF